MRVVQKSRIMHRGGAASDLIGLTTLNVRPAPRRRCLSRDLGGQLVCVAGIDRYAIAVRVGQLEILVTKEFVGFALALSAQFGTPRFARGVSFELVRRRLAASDLQRSQPPENRVRLHDDRCKVRYEGFSVR
jgi:hypothetical protein